MEKIKNSDDKNVIIVGTGVAAALMAKQLSNYFFNPRLKSFKHSDFIEPSQMENYQPIKVLMLEAGLEEGVELIGESAYKIHKKYQNKFDTEVAKVPNSPYFNLQAAPSPDVLHVPNQFDEESKQKGYLVQNGPMAFLSDAIRTGGGTTMHWLGSTPRMLPNDFRLKSKFGRAVDWPIEHDELKPYYDFAEYELGVSGRDVSMDEKDPILRNSYILNGSHEFPMKEIPMSYSDKYVAEELQISEGKSKINFLNEQVEIKLHPTPQARNSFPNEKYKKSFYFSPTRCNCDETYELTTNSIEKTYTIVGTLWNQYEGNRCEGNASCVPFCPAQAKYNALKTLKQAKYKFSKVSKRLVENENVEILTQTVVYKVEANQETGNITKVLGKKYVQRQVEGNTVLDVKEVFIDTTDKIVVLATNAIENPKILLNSPYKVGQTIANKSNQVGRNLMDHMVYLAWGYAKDPVYPFRGPGSTANISAFRDGKFRSKFAPFFGPIDNWGWSWPTFSPGSDLTNLLDLDLIGKPLKSIIGKLVEKQLLLKWEVEQLPNPRNNVSIDPKYVDDLGIPRPVIAYNISDYEKDAIIEARTISQQIFNSLGAVNKTQYAKGTNSFEDNEGNIYAFKGAGHIVGTHRIGNKPENSVTNSHCKTWEHDNLYLIGTGSMPTLGTSNPTLTMAALTLRATESLLSDLTKLFKKQ